MNRKILYVVLFVLLCVVVVGLSILYATQKQKHRFDNTITLSYKDKRPYGAYVAYREMSYIFPGAPLVLSRRTEAYVEDLEDSDHHQVMFVLSPQFYANVYEWNQLIRWVKQGNYLVIAANRFSQNVKDDLHIQLSNFSQEMVFEENAPTGYDDSLRLGLRQPPFDENEVYAYPGRRMDRAVVSLDSSFTEVAGTNDLHYANLIHIQAGEGGIFLQTAPLAFSNYFLLYGDNMRYFEHVWSLIPAKIDKVVWNEYYLYKRNEDERTFWPLEKLLQDPYLRPAFLLLLLILIVYVLLNMKRRQRIIPATAPKSNESLDFVKTIGRLYHGKGDHLNLAVKMVQHFQEFTRNRYQVKLELGDEASIMHLSNRSGVPDEVVRNLATHIRYVYDAPGLTVEQLEDLYGLLETFYKTAQ